MRRRRFSDSVIGKQCPICLDRIEIRSAAVIIPCEHAYCIGCIRRWSQIKRKCPLCNANFTSWFNNDCEEKLLPFSRGKSVNPLPPNDVLLRSRRSQFSEHRRLIRRSIEEASRVQSRARVLPKQRSFIGSSNEITAARINQWRASIYEKRLQAVPTPSKNSLVKQIPGNNIAKEMTLRRIEPWIKRELQAVLRDPDPTVIVHVATSLFISIYEKNGENNVRSRIDFLAPLRPFLCEKTEIFWHELGCFAESSFSMETYDTVVEYKRVED